MTTTGVIFVSLLFIILICGIYIMGQAETIKQQNKELKESNDALNNLIQTADEHLELTREYKRLVKEREKLRERTSSDLDGTLQSRNT